MLDEDWHLFKIINYAGSGNIKHEYRKCISNNKKNMSLLKQRLPLEALRVYQKRYRISDSNKHVTV
jgi:hypothetical protein